MISKASAFAVSIFLAVSLAALATPAQVSATAVPTKLKKGRPARNLVAKKLGYKYVQVPNWKVGLEADVRFGVHLNAPQTGSTGRTGVNLFGVWDPLDHLKMLWGVRYENEGIEKNVDANLLRPIDTYARWTYSPLQITAGYQQVVWGETFGNNISDIVNPKDNRELGLETPAAARLQIPLVNLQVLNLHSSFQLLYIPFPQFSLMPKLGSDFAPQLPPGLGGVNLILDDADPEKFNRGEWGGRYSRQFSNLDIALFYLDYFDRNPVYDLAFDFAQFNRVHLVPHHRPLKTYGLNLTYDFDGYLGRLETVYSPEKVFNVLTATALSESTFADLNYILGLDLPEFFWNTRVGFQYSEEKLRVSGRSNFDPYVNRFDVFFRRNFRAHDTGEMLASVFTLDGGSLFQVKYEYSVNKTWLLQPALDVLCGSSTSLLGPYRNASRVLLTVKSNIN